MAKQNITEIFEQAKKVTDDIAKTVTDTTNRITEDIKAKKEAEIQAIKDKIDEIMQQLEGDFAFDFLKDLGACPVELTKTSIAKAKELFPIPREQTILWMDAEFDLRPSGIICTDRGVFVKTNIELFEKLPQDKKDKPRSILVFYQWEDFDPAWFVSDAPESNKVLLVESQCRDRFISTCKKWVKEEKTPDEELSNFVYEDSEIEEMLAKVTPIGIAGIQSSESAVFVEHKSHINTPAGHGEMAEEFITKIDSILGHDAKVVGRDNAKDGADRVVDGIFIQTKYYNSARGSLEACFRPEDGVYRYMKDGKPMQLEVPKDQYDKVLKGFERKIEQGKVPGVTDPKEAKNIVRKGRITYKQSVNLTKPGTIESLSYDALTGVVTCSCALGITFVITTYLTWRKTGDIKQAIKAGAYAGVQVFGISFIQHMVVSQIARTSLANALIGPSQYVVGKLGFQNAATIVNGIRALSGKGAIYGAAASKHLAKILRSNVLISAITFTVFSIPETYKVASKKISAAQYTKNLTVLVGSIAGGAGGAIAAGVVAAKVAGAAGTAVAPGIGTVIGIAGGFVGGVVGSKAVDIVGDILREDDTDVLGRLFNAIISCMIGEYLLDSTEMDALMQSIDKLEGKEFKNLFASIMQADKQEDVIRNFLSPRFDEIVNAREKFNLPNPVEIMEAIIEE